MSEKYYSAEQAAQMLHMHIKTVQRYIREGKLKANKVGKSWRITGHDLSVFAEGEQFPPTQGRAEMKTLVSAVADVQGVEKDEAVRIMNTLTAAMNAKPQEQERSSLAVQYLESLHTVRVTLWGSLPFMEAMISFMSALTGQTEQEE